MAQRVKLHGGPLHGTEMDVVDGVQHFHILGYRDPDHSILGIQPSEDTPLTRRGTYSKVRYYGETDFEWDGWDK